MKILYYLASPKYFYNISEKILPYLSFLTCVLFLVGLTLALLFAPADYQQGNAFRIMYVHVPCAVLSLFVYGVMSVCVFVFLVWKIKLVDILAKGSAILGAMFTFLALVTGSIWGKPMWGTWWIWDARLTSELILLFIYLAIISLRSAIVDKDIAGKASGILTLVGLVDLPIIHYSVYWWNTLHQQATVLKFSKPSMSMNMLVPLLIMLAAFFCYYLWMCVLLTRKELLQREKKSKWVRELQ